MNSAGGTTATPPPREAPRFAAVQTMQGLASFSCGMESLCDELVRTREASRRQREINSTSVKKAITDLELSVFKKPVPSTHGQKRHEPAPGYKQPTLFERLLWKLFRKPLSAGRPTTLAE